jgi:hypothetical protein
LVVAKDYPSDFEPKLAVLFHPLDADADARQVTRILKEAFATAKTQQDRNLCLLITPSLALRMAKCRNADAGLSKFSAWIQALRSAPTETGPPPSELLDHVEFFTALAQKDFSKAADLARSTKLRSLEPLMLILAQRFEEARQRVEEMKGDETLTDEERRSLDTALTLIQSLQQERKESE